VAVAMIGSVIVLLVIIFLLRRREKAQDEAEQRERDHLFSFNTL
jgi:heme exporter protein D